MKHITPIISYASIISLIIISSIPVTTFAAYKFSDFKASPPIHVLKSNQTTPTGISPSQIKSIYHLPNTGGHGTIAIISAYHDPNLEKELGVFSSTYTLSPCTIKNKCLEEHTFDTKTSSNTDWSMETSLDVEWAHAIAPNAKILVVEAKTQSGANLLKAIDYARSRKDVVAISMSFGGTEFSDESSLDSHFTSVSGASFFASSGDSGAGVNWPAVSSKVIAVGGTSLTLNENGGLVSETAWTGSGGGISSYEQASTPQKAFSLPKSNGMRAIPDVAYSADPVKGFPIYRSSGNKGSWYEVGGTSAGAPQWAAIHSLGLSATISNLYKDKSSAYSTNYFRDITSGTNGSCGYFCSARNHFDYVTGLGSPLTIHF